MKELILIVDDNPDLVELLQVPLKIFGYEVLVASNGLEAVEIAHLKLPDLIVMDMFMPVMDGIQATSLMRLNPKTKDIPILAATASAAPGDRERCLAAGCDDYISKPFSYRELAAAIEKLLKGRESKVVPKENYQPGSF